MIYDVAVVGLGAMAMMRVDKKRAPGGCRALFPNSVAGDGYSVRVTCSTRKHSMMSPWRMSS
jgi:hypothetical protein